MSTGCKQCDEAQKKMHNKTALCDLCFIEDCSKEIRAYLNMIERTVMRVRQSNLRLRSVQGSEEIRELYNNDQRLQSEVLPEEH
jgi:hypothetical protein